MNGFMGLSGSEHSFNLSVSTASRLNVTQLDGWCVVVGRAHMIKLLQPSAFVRVVCSGATMCACGGKLNVISECS